MRVAYLCDFPLCKKKKKKNPHAYTHTHIHTLSLPLSRAPTRTHTHSERDAAEEHLKHELVFAKKEKAQTWTELPLKRTAGSSNCYLLQAINEDRDAHFCSSLSLVLPLAAAHIVVHFNFFFLSLSLSVFLCVQEHRGKGGKREGFFSSIFSKKFYFCFLQFICFFPTLPFSPCNKYERSLCCHFTLEINMCRFLCSFAGRIRETTKRCDRSLADNCGFQRVTAVPEGMRGVSAGPPS